MPLNYFAQRFRGAQSTLQHTLNLGLVLAAEGKYPEAEREFRLALRSSAKNLNAYNALGMIRRQVGRGYEAIEILQKGVAARPDSAIRARKPWHWLSQPMDLIAWSACSILRSDTVGPQFCRAHFNKDEFCSI